MLVTPAIDRHNRTFARAASVSVASFSLITGWFYTPLLVLLALAPIVYWMLRRRCRRRTEVARRPFPPEWRIILERRVRFYQALDDAQKERFRQMVSVFLDEIRVTGVRTEVDDTIRVRPRALTNRPARFGSTSARAWRSPGKYPSSVSPTFPRR